MKHFIDKETSDPSPLMSGSGIGAIYIYRVICHPRFL